MPLDELDEYLKRVYLPTLLDILEKCPPKDSSSSLIRFFSISESEVINSDTGDSPVSLDSMIPPTPESDNSK